MNKFVLLSDIHGNAPALQAVVDEEGLDQEYLVLGDIHGLNAYPKETVDLVKELDGYTLSGNHDKAIFQYGEGHVVSDALSKFERNHTLANLSADDVQWMLGLQHLDVFQRGPSRICITHAMPWPEMASGYEPGNAGISKRHLTKHASAVEEDYDYVFSGHSHEQYSQDCEKFGHNVHFVNPGTLGYDGNYAVVDTDTGDVELKHVDYDEQAVKEHIQSVLPDDCPNVNRWF